MNILIVITTMVSSVVKQNYIFFDKTAIETIEF